MNACLQLLKLYCLFHRSCNLKRNNNSIKNPPFGNSFNTLASAPSASFAINSTL